MTGTALLIRREVLAADYARARRRDDRAGMKAIHAEMRAVVAMILKSKVESND